MEELITAASATATGTGAPPTDAALAGADLTEIFGVELETAPPASQKPTEPKPQTPSLLKRRQSRRGGKTKSQRKAVKKK